MPNQAYQSNKVIAYLRKSTNRGQTYSFEAQREELTGYAQVNKLEIIAWYEEVMSGGKDDRPELLKAINRCEKEGVSLMTTKIDRLGRSVAHLAALMERPKLRIIISQLGLTADPMVLHMHAVIAEHERHLISERTKAGLQRAKENGVILGGPKLSEARKKAVVSNRKRGQRTYDRFGPTFKRYRDEGWTYQQIADHMNQLGVKTVRGFSWKANSVRQILI